MSIYITSLNSGSNGNCYYVGNDQEAILVDAGISCRETETRMKHLGLSMERVKAIFISHEHTDHIKGLPVLAKKYKLPVYITPATLREGRLELASELVRTFQPHEAVPVGELLVTAFPKLHDAIDPFSFIITGKDAGSGQEVTIGVFTDIGLPCNELTRYFKRCHAAFLETNYDEDMLENGHYPYHLKNRIRGGKGHLSNRQALEFFRAHKPSFMSHILLSHLSRDNNEPSLVQSMFEAHGGGTHVVIASRYEQTEVYCIRPGVITATEEGYEPVYMLPARPATAKPAAVKSLRAKSDKEAGLKEASNKPTSSRRTRTSGSTDAGITQISLF